MRSSKLIALMILLSLSFSLQVSAFELKDLYEKNLNSEGLIKHIIDVPENLVPTGKNSEAKTKMCSSRADKSKPCMACIANCGKGPTTEIEPYQDKDGNWKGRQIICIDGGESLECHCRFDACRVSCGGGPSTNCDCLGC
jgi:hypothetical protein|tara:strand:- start:198 stop:617 length:420 start_codon:yes stop_codon:yes gene_type:complete